MTRRRRGPVCSLSLWLCLCLCLPSCLGYVRYRTDEPVALGSLEALQAGQDDLTACLAALGAPARAFEFRGSGMALLWVWRDVDDWSFDVSVPLQDNVSASFELDLTDTELPGCMLWFGPDLVLERWRRGTIGELLPARARPSDPDAAGG